MNFSWIALLLSVVATLPQLYQTVSTGLVRDHNELSPLIAIVANFFLALHGYTRKDYGLVLFGLWFIVFNSVIAYYKQLAPAPTE
jgi:hypothetical protein